MSHPLFSLCSKVGRGFSFRYLLCVKRGLWPFGSDSWIDWLYLDVHLKNCILWIGIKMPSQIRSTANAEVLAVWTCSITIYLDVLFPPWITISIYFPGMWGGWARVTAEMWSVCCIRELVASKERTELWNLGHLPKSNSLSGWPWPMRCRIWTADRRRWHGLEAQEHCLLCDQEKETNVHILVHCSFTKQIWWGVMNSLGCSCSFKANTLSLQQRWTHLRRLQPAPKRKDPNSVFMQIVWHLCKERNSRLFQSSSASPHQVQGCILKDCHLWFSDGALHLGRLLHE